MESATHLPLLPDPCNDRQMKHIMPPPHKSINTDMLYKGGKPDWKIVHENLKREGRVTRECFIRLISDAISLFKKQKNLLYLKDPITIVGDIHGQFYDLLKLIEIGGGPDSTKYLFLGDYVDRGSFSVEVLVLLYTYKINFPKTVVMLRGNHECRQMTSYFNFRQEVLSKYDQDVYDLIMESFDSMPLSCIVNEKFIALHGGISPELKSLDDLDSIGRFREPPSSGILCDILWSDPNSNEDGFQEVLFKANEVRGCSFFYGAKAVRRFLKKNRLLSVLRAHEAQLEGYKMHHWNGKSEFPTVITVFSAPNYCDVYNNKGAILKFNSNTLNIQQFNYNQHPFILPNFMDIFTWSMPFVSQKVVEMLHHLVKASGPMDGNQEDKSKAGALSLIDSDPSSHIDKKRIEVLRNKVKSVSKMLKMFRVLREENELIMQLRGFCPDEKLPRGILLKGREAIKTALDAFSRAKEVDKVNERRPKLK